MQLFHDIKEWQSVRNRLSNEQSLGFLATMGNLHQGHEALIKRSLLENDKTIVSIFVNPTQFNRKEDLKHYPRTIEKDLIMLNELNVDYCLIPSDKDMYPDQFHFQLNEHHVCNIMEGKHRPGHFKGVLTVVMKLFNIINPHRSYWGEKDYQQYLLIKEMVRAFFMNIDIIPCSTVREHSGLALSSRNNRLNQEQKKKAYLEEHFNRRFIAVHIDNIRLIDNYPLR